MKVEIPRTSMTLIDLVKRGDEDAWFRFVDVYTELIYSQCVNSNLNSGDAGEVTSDVFVSLVSAVQSFKKRNSTDRFHHFLRRITTYRIRDHKNAKRRRRELEHRGDLDSHHSDIRGAGGLSMEQVDQIWSHEELQEAIRLRVVRDAKQHFGDETFGIYTLLIIEGRPVTNVATEFNVTAAQADQRADEVAAWVANAAAAILADEPQATDSHSAQEQEILNQLAGKFEPKTIEAYRLKTFAKMPIKIVALELDLSEGAVRVAAHRVKKWVTENVPNVLKQDSESDADIAD